MSPSNTMAPDPENANEGCVGPSSEDAGKSSACDGCPSQGACSSGKFNTAEAKEAKKQQQQTMNNSLSNIHHVILVLSGKGGVGKSTVASQLAFSLAYEDYSVGLLDIDICGPSIPRMVGVLGQEIHKSGNGWSPVYAHPNLGVMSIAFLLQDSDSAVVWRGPRKNGMIEQFLTETDWSSSIDGDNEYVDYLIIDTPPGTSDEHISIVQFLQSSPSVHALVVTTPEEISMADVRKELNFCKKTNLNVLGIIENMCTTTISSISDLKFSNEDNKDCTDDVLENLKKLYPDIFNMKLSYDIIPSYGDGPKGMADKFNVPYLGNIPLDTNLLKSCENGKCFTDEFKNSDATKSLLDIVTKVVKALPIVDDNIDGNDEDDMM